MKALKISAEDVRNIEKMHQQILSHNKIGTIVSASIVAFNLLKNSTDLQPGTESFEEEAIHFASNIIETERRKLGLSSAIREPRASS